MYEQRGVLPSQDVGRFSKVRSPPPATLRERTSRPAARAPSAGRGRNPEEDARLRASRGRTRVWALPPAPSPANASALEPTRAPSRKVAERKSRGEGKPPHWGQKGNTGGLERRGEEPRKPFWRQTDLSARGHAKWTFSARGSEAQGAGDRDSDSAGGRGGARDRSGKDTASQRRGARGARTHWRKTLEPQTHQPGEAPHLLPNITNYGVGARKCEVAAAKVPLKLGAERMSYLGPLFREKQGKPEDSLWMIKNSAILFRHRLGRTQGTALSELCWRAGGWETGIESHRGRTGESGISLVSGWHCFASDCCLWLCTSSPRHLQFLTHSLLQSHLFLAMLPEFKNCNVKLFFFFLTCIFSPSAGILCGKS